MKTKLARRLRCRNRRGFTLMEILLVLAILVILGALVGVGFNKIRQNALIDSAKTQISSLESGVKLYQIDVGRYPGGDSGLQALYIEPSDAPPSKWRGPYLEGTQLPLDPWGNDYEYSVFLDERNEETFEIWSNGPDQQPGTTDDVRIIR
jgi:general secretion pathway protein G